jgi:drug/metabolite transporter (DMT)-like permease
MSGQSNVTVVERETEGLLHGCIGVLIFSASMVGTRSAAPELGGVFVGLGRGTFAALLAGAVLFWRGGRVPERRHWPGLCIVAAGSVIGFPLLSALAMERVPASHGMVFVALMPALTAAAAVARAGERPSPRFWAWSIAAAGVVAAFSLREGTGALQAADLLLASGAGLSAIAYAEGARLSRELGGMTVLSWALVFALPVVLPGTVLAAWVHPVHGSLHAWLGLAYISFCSMYVGFLFWYRGLSLGGIARVSQVQTLQPLLGLAWAGLILGEPLPLSLVGTALAVIVCVAMGRR